MGDIMNKMTKPVLVAAAMATALGGFAAPAFAQRDPAYAAARSSGQVGERMTQCGQLPIEHGNDAGISGVEHHIVESVVAVHQAAGAVVGRHILG